MERSFKTILIPVDFSINTEVAVAKALDVLDADGATIHLLHVKRGTLTLSVAETPSPEMQKLEAWKKNIEASMPAVSVQWWIDCAGSVEQCIRQTAQHLAADLIVVGKSSTHSWARFTDTVLPMRLAERAGIPVLTAKPGALHSKLRTVVVPVSAGTPQTKMAAIEMLCRRGRLNIHLLAFGQHRLYPRSAATALLQMFKWIRNSLHCPVEYALLEGDDKVRRMLEYAERVDADVLLVYPELETRVGFWKRQISDVLPAASKVQVLAMQPTQV